MEYDVKKHGIRVFDNCKEDDEDVVVISTDINVIHGYYHGWRVSTVIDHIRKLGYLEIYEMLPFSLMYDFSCGLKLKSIKINDELAHYDSIIPEGFVTIDLEMINVHNATIQELMDDNNYKGD